MIGIKTTYEMKTYASNSLNCRSSIFIIHVKNIDIVTWARGRKDKDILYKHYQHQAVLLNPFNHSHKRYITLPLVLFKPSLPQDILLLSLCTTRERNKSRPSTLRDQSMIANSRDPERALNKHRQATKSNYLTAHPLVRITSRRRTKHYIKVWSRILIV